MVHWLVNVDKLLIDSMQRKAVEGLEADLRAERSAHEATLRDAEATLVELEDIRGAGASQAEASQQEELLKEREARRAAEVSFDSVSFGRCLGYLGVQT